MSRSRELQYKQQDLIYFQICYDERSGTILFCFAGAEADPEFAGASVSSIEATLPQRPLLADEEEVVLEARSATGADVHAS
jgi:hypothetical protein